jgi:hypothetical protein
VVGDAQFLQLSVEENRFIELKLALATGVRELRERRGDAGRVGASAGIESARVAMTEAAGRSVPLNLIMRSFLTIGPPPPALPSGSDVQKPRELPGDTASYLGFSMRAALASLSRLGDPRLFSNHARAVRRIVECDMLTGALGTHPVRGQGRSPPLGSGFVRETSFSPMCGRRAL